MREGILVKIEFPPDSFDDAEKYLRLAGLNVFTYYPDLEGLALAHEARVATELRDAHRLFPGLFSKGKGAP